MRRRGAALILLAVTAVSAAAGFASAASLTVTGSKITTFRVCTLTGYPTTSAVSADTWVNENSKTQTNGGDTALKISARSNQNKRAYVRFDLTTCNPTIATTASVKDARLRLFLFNVSGSTRTYNAYPVTATWGETTLDWDPQPTASGTATASVTINSGAANNNKYYSWNVTSDVGPFVAGTASNYGWWLGDSAEDSADVSAQFRSREAASNATGAPQLVIVYAP